MKMNFNSVFKKTKQAEQTTPKHKDIDYAWLFDQALDEKTKTNLQIMKAARQKFADTGRHPYVGKNLRLRLKGGTINARSHKPYSTMMVYQEIFLGNEHQKAAGFDLAQGTLIDIGANEGFYTIKMCLRNPNLQAICVEPSSATYRLLRQNIKLNNLENRVKLIKAAVWSDNQKQTLLSLPSTTSNAGLVNSSVHSPWLLRKGARKETVPAITLEEILRMASSEVDLLKIDTEGSELEILKGGIESLDRVRRVVVEYHSEYLREAVMSLLADKGFKCSYETRDDPVSITSGNLYFNR